MPKENSQLFTQSLLRYAIMKIRTLGSVSIWVILALVFAGAFILYLGNYPEEVPDIPQTFTIPIAGIVGIAKDRSSTYKVKVFPNDLDDATLNALPKNSFSYLAMIDAGSSGCRAHVYRYGKLGTIDGPLYVLPDHVSKKVKPGLSR